MKRTFLSFLFVPALLGQTQPGATAFQPAGALAGGRGGRGVILQMPRAETGKPFSALVTTRTVQTLSDGTHVTHVTTMLEYRDAEGRVRTEASEPPEPVKSIRIQDPVAGVIYTLDVANKIATKRVAAATVPNGGGRGGRAGSGGAEDLEAAMARLRELAQSIQAERKGVAGSNVEQLETATISGVLAHGTRTTTVVPLGAIGNDKEFRSVDERWFSPDLNLLIKSVSTDPRFGTTTYEVTNINRQAPDPALFRVPADYTIH